MSWISNLKQTGRRARLLSLAVAGGCFFTFQVVTADEQSRTWTSADGSRTFEGKFRSFDETSGEAEVLINGQSVKFSIDLLSAADAEYIRGLAKKEDVLDPSQVKEAVEQTALGAQILKAKPLRFDGRRYRRADLVKVPEYYVLYYAASW